jgi:cell division GTPase FtsZ
VRLISSVDTLIVLDLNRTLKLDGKVEESNEYLPNCVRALATAVFEHCAFTDIKLLLKDMGLCAMGYGYNNFRIDDKYSGVAPAAREALDMVGFSTKDTNKVICFISGKTAVSKSEAEEAARIIKERIHPDAILLSRAFVDPKSEYGSLTFIGNVGGYPNENHVSWLNETANIKKNQ